MYYSFETQRSHLECNFVLTGKRNKAQFGGEFQTDGISCPISSKVSVLPRLQVSQLKLFEE